LHYVYIHICKVYRWRFGCECICMAHLFFILFYKNGILWIIFICYLALWSFRLTGYVCTSVLCCPAERLSSILSFEASYVGLFTVMSLFIEILKNSVCSFVLDAKNLFQKLPSQCFVRNHLLLTCYMRIRLQVSDFSFTLFIFYIEKYILSVTCLGFNFGECFKNQVRKYLLVRAGIVLAWILFHQQILLL
jgi:hypothetical protein